MSLALGLLETAIIGSKTATIVSSVGTNLIIGTITTTTSSIGSMIRYLTTSSQPGINDILTVLVTCDLEFTVSIIEQLVKELDSLHFNESVKKALVGVEKILSDIHAELNSIKEAIDSHNAKYFNGYRSLCWSGNIDNIKRHNNVLIHRYTMLFELLKINK